MKYSFTSDIYRRLVRNEKANGGLTLSLTDKQIQTYFTTTFSETQLFATIFAYWCKLSEEQINQVTSPKRSAYAWDILNYFICNPDDKSVSLSKSEFEQYRYLGEYHVENHAQGSVAMRIGSTLIVKQTGEIFEIL